MVIHMTYYCCCNSSFLMFSLQHCFVDTVDFFRSNTTHNNTEHLQNIIKLFETFSSLIFLINCSDVVMFCLLIWWCKTWNNNLNLYNEYLYNLHNMLNKFQYLNLCHVGKSNNFKIETYASWLICLGRDVDLHGTLYWRYIRMLSSSNRNRFTWSFGASLHTSAGNGCEHFTSAFYCTQGY